jgi:hypothetical protein
MSEKSFLIKLKLKFGIMEAVDLPIDSAFRLNE